MLTLTIRTSAPTLPATASTWARTVTTALLARYPGAHIAFATGAVETRIEADGDDARQIEDEAHQIVQNAQLDGGPGWAKFVAWMEQGD